MSYARQPMVHEACYQAFCARPDFCTVKGGWGGRFYFDQLIPQRCPKCNSHTRVESLNYNRRKDQEAAQAEQKRAEHEAALAEHQRKIEEARREIEVRQEQEAIVTAADGTQEVA